MALLSLIALIVGIYIFRKKLNPKNRNTNAMIVLGVVVLGVVVYLPFSGIEPQSNKTSTVKQVVNKEKPKVSDTARDEVVAYFKSGKEPKVKDSVWTQDSIFKVGMINDKTDRSGYAEYVCTVLYDFGFKGQKVWVQVIDIAKLVKNNEWEKMGEAHCL
jgi:hypothetical protein